MHWPILPGITFLCDLYCFTALSTFQNVLSFTISSKVIPTFSKQLSVSSGVQVSSASGTIFHNLVILPFEYFLECFFCMAPVPFTCVQFVVELGKNIHTCPQASILSCTIVLLLAKSTVLQSKSANF